jgi:hypothetical protein
MRQSSSIFLILLLGLLPAACNGNIGDLFSIFPASAFAPDEPDGEQPNPGVPGAFEPTEVGFLGATQGVTGDVRNIALATLNSQTYAFLAAGADGVHMVNVTDASTINPSSYITTIDDTVLLGTAAELAGGRVDDIAVLGNAYLVCVAVGSGSANAVTIFHIQTLIERATSSPADLSDAFVPGSGNILADGTPGGNGGGVSGASIAGVSVFLVASGGPTLGGGFISAGTPGTWTAIAPASSTTPQIDNFVKVEFGAASAYAVVAQGDTIALATVAISVTPTIGITVNETLLPLTGVFSTLDASLAATPGTFPATTALDVAQTLYVSEQNALRTYSAVSPGVPTESDQLFSAGFDIGGIAAQPGFLAISNSSSLTFYSNLAGPFARIGAFQSAGRRNFGVEFTSGTGGRFAIVCADSNGMRVIQWSDIS